MIVIQNFYQESDRTAKAETIYKYLLVLQQKLKKVSSFQHPNDQIVFITNEFIEVLDRFAPITKNRKF